MTNKEKLDVLYEEHMKKVKRKDNIKIFFEFVFEVIMLALFFSLPWIFIVTSIVMYMQTPIKIILIVLSSIMLIMECSLFCFKIGHSENK